MGAAKYAKDIKQVTYIAFKASRSEGAAYPDTFR